MAGSDNRSLGSVADLARQLGIASWEKLNGKQVAKILELVGQAKITELEVQKIIELASGFAPIAASVFQSIQVTSEKANDSQVRMLENHSVAAQSTLDELKNLLKNAVGDENKIKIAQMITDLSKEELAGVVKMNQSNNNFWSVVVASGMAVAAMGVLVLRVVK